MSCFWRGRILRDYCYGNGTEKGCSVVYWVIFSSWIYSDRLIQYSNVAGDVGTDGDGICRVGDDVRQLMEAWLCDDHMAVLVAISFYSRVLRRVRFKIVCDWWSLLDVILGLRSHEHINIHMHVCGLFSESTHVCPNPNNPMSWKRSTNIESLVHVAYTGLFHHRDFWGHGQVGARSCVLQLPCISITIVGLGLT